MSGDPDFILRINGQDVSAYAQEWELIDDEEHMSEITVKLGNPDLKFSGMFDYGQDLEIRFGYFGGLSGKAYLPVADVEEDYPDKALCTITIKGRDESAKMSGGKCKGNLGSGDPRDGLKAKLQDIGLKAKIQGQGQPTGKTGPMNENCAEYIHRVVATLRDGSQDSGGGSDPSSPVASDEGKEAKAPAKGHQFSSHERNPTKGKGRDNNRSKNDHGKHGGEPITGTLELTGYPSLRAKGTVTILGVGSKASGTYYVKKCHHHWALGKGFTTKADLVRGGSGKGDAGSNPPMVGYSDIWNKGTIYLGPRKLDGESQGTFTYGQGQDTMSFKYKCAPQKNRHGAEKAGEGHGIDPRARHKTFITNQAGG